MKKWVEDPTPYQPETIEDARGLGCWCASAPKPCGYHEGFDDGVEMIRMRIERHGGLD